MFDKIVALLQKVEGRDKLTKLMIYLLKLIDALRTMIQKRPTYRMERIAIHFQKARQFMRLGKFILEYQEVIQLIHKSTRDEFGRFVNIILRAIFSFYWALDNLALVSSYGLINIPSFEISQTAMTIKFFGMTIAALLNLRTWLRLHHEELKARRQLKYLKGEANLSKDRELMDLVFQQWKMFLLCVKILGDMLPTIAKSAIAKKILKIKVPRLAQAMGGLISALVSCLIAAY